MWVQDKTALITGSTAGIGYAIATALDAEGATIIINGRSQKSVDATLVCYLASPLASATTGAAMRVDGGTVKSAF